MFGIYRNGELIEGGFFSRDAADDTAGEYPGATVKRQCPTADVPTDTLSEESRRILKEAAGNCGFLTREETDTMTLAGGAFAAIPVIVRCGCQRFTCEVRELRAGIAVIEAQGDYVRDVSILPGRNPAAKS